ncbi:MAG: Spx/MgsR family RNA polymerase-binding regulatory protein [Arcobacteraceae bacterium]|jgi:Spx/MgsR family transcriptional regulator|nr:Spx/MgsR family RNA polymerase-binding regulatory protein [Arcobacteraceae bacterium]MDY0364931.1 Spx/MgsR family RNA polymerase-binding regulatory protein [Arcobacteraceae bacterium]
MKIYGIKTCGSVKKAFSFFNEKNIEYEFIDLKKVKLTEQELDQWLLYIPLDKLLNTKGTTYKKLQLKELNLDDKGKKEWLLKEHMLFKRPIIVSNKSITCGVDEFDKHL